MTMYVVAQGDFSAWHEADGIQNDQGPQQIIKTENLWLNVILVLSFKLPFSCHYIESGGKAK